jgi:small subunit ribosomal protein S1
MSETLEKTLELKPIVDATGELNNNEIEGKGKDEENLGFEAVTSELDSNDTDKAELHQSWMDDEQLSELARIKRNNEITRGVVRSVGYKKIRILEDGHYVTKEVEVAFIMLEGGVLAYCPAHEFSAHQFKSLNGFTGTIQDVVIDELDLENRLALVSVKKADEIKKQRFYAELEELERKGKLTGKTFEGVVSGYNPKTERIFVKVNGADCYMLKYDWDWGRVRNLGDIIERGEKIKVKVIRFDKDRDLIRVSRKDTMPDPFEILENLKDMETVAGIVSEVHPIHGIFVQLDVGLEVKGMKPSYLEEPVVGDIVACKVRKIDRKNRRAKVVIVSYPRGKKKRKDIGSFLFE